MGSAPSSAWLRSKRLPYTPVQPHLVIDGLARICLELLLVLVLSGIEHLAHNAIVQVDDLVRNGGCCLHRHGDQGRVSALRLELGIRSAEVI